MAPIDVLRHELIELVKEIIPSLSTEDRILFQSEIIPLLRKNDDYVRAQARSFVKIAREHGLKVDLTFH